MCWKLADARAVRMVRTDEGKKLRKQYENHEIHHGFNEYREMDIRPDEVANTITTVEKDQYIAIKQATKQGYILCKNGGSRFKLSYKQTKKRTCHRRRGGESYNHERRAWNLQN